MDKIKGDFHIKGTKPTTRRTMFKGSTVAISITLGLFFVNKFVWSPFKSDKRFREAQSEIDLLLSKEEALRNGPEIE